MYVVITTEEINGRDSRTCDLLATQAEAHEFATSQRRDLKAVNRSAIIEVHRLGARSLDMMLRVEASGTRTRKRGCRR